MQLSFLAQTIPAFATCFDDPDRGIFQDQQQIIGHYEAPTLSDCTYLCKFYTQCRSWTYYIDDHTCILFYIFIIVDSILEVSNDDCVSGWMGGKNILQKLIFEFGFKTTSIIGRTKHFPDEVLYASDSMFYFNRS